MEIQCPKCHFVQPKDQYCARCGVDMQKYKPQNVSVFQKLNLQVSILFLVALIVLGATVYFFKLSDKPLSTSFSEFSGVKSFRSTEKATTSSTDDTQTDAAKDSTTQRGKVDLKVADDTILDQFSGTSEASTKSRGSQNEFSNTRIKISFVEIDHDSLNAMMGESQNQGLLQRDGDQFKGILTNMAFLAQVKYKTLKEEVKEIRPNQIEAFFFGKTTAQTAQFLGLQLNLEKKSADGTDPKWLLTVNTSKQDGKETATLDFSINKNSVLFINAKNWVGNFENERQLSDTAPFNALTSSDFLNQRTEILILLEIY